MERIEQHASFGGRQEVWQHASATLGCTMRLGVYLPEAALRGERCPVLYWLSGLTCTEQNFITKAGAQPHAARHGLIVVAPDTSPRDPERTLGVADDDAYDLGQGAGFYVNATEPPWAAHYRMQDYVAEELPALVERSFGAGAQRVVDVVVVGMEREDQHTHIGCALLDVRHRLLAVGERHRDIHDDEIRPQQFRGTDGLAAVAGEAYHFQVLLLRQQRVQAITHDAVVVGDQDAFDAGHGWLVM